VVDDLRFPGEDPERRAALEARTDAPGGLAALYAELAAADPVAASRMEPTNRRRIVRALEVMAITGEPFSASGAGLEQFGDPVFPVRTFGIWLPPAVLERRIRERVDHMYAAGLLDEVRALTGAGGPGLSRTAAQAIGYREALAVLDGTAPDEAAARAATALRTRQLARRQVRWFRRDPRITWWGTAANPGALGPALLECCR
jgi:tRNA dimethylallyltransferase